jgi:hypothetical protein
MGLKEIFKGMRRMARPYVLMRERLAVVLFFIRNSHFDRHSLCEVIREAVEQLELLGYPSIEKRVESLINGLRRSHGGKNGAESRQNDAWGTCILEATPTKYDNDRLNKFYSNSLLSFGMAVYKNGGQKIQKETE